LRRVLSIVFLVATQAAAQGPVGAPFQINESISGSVSFPDVASQPDGSFVVVWSSDQDGDGAAVRARRFSRNGSALSGEFGVNEETLGDQFRPRVATDGRGDFVVVWSGQDGDGTGVSARLFAADGTALGPEFQVNAETAGSQQHPAVSRSASGAILVSWFDHTSDSVAAATFDAAGSPMLAEFVVSTTGLYPGTSDLACGIRSDGDFVVAWVAAHEVGGSPTTDIFQKRYSAGGVPLSGDFQLSDPGPNGWYFSYNPDLGVDEHDNFLVVWHTQLNLAWGQVRGRRTDASGMTGPIRELSDASEGHEFSMAPGGEFVVQWFDYFAYGIESSRFDALGNEVDSFPVPEPYGLGAQSHLSRDSTEFVTAHRPGGPEPGLIGQRFGSRLFADGFESGDTAEWSETVP